MVEYELNTCSYTICLPEYKDEYLQEMFSNKEHIDNKIEIEASNQASLVEKELRFEKTQYHPA